MTEMITRSFVITTELKNLLEQWAKEEDRSVSYIIRQILKAEAQRRQRVLANQEQASNEAYPSESSNWHDERYHLPK